jgi:stress-induced morphogen
MMNTEDIEKMLQAELPDAVIAAMDLTGTADHFEVRVEWAGFKGMMLIDQHQTINKVLKEPLGDGRIHALKIKTMIPEA